MKKYKAILVDDDEKNLNLLNHFIDQFCLQIDVVGSKKTIIDAITLINSEKPKILYLDIKLRKGTSFDILDKINYKDFAIIFITAYKDFAVKAIKFNVVDYILKPLSIEDLILATNKAILAVNEKEKLNSSVVAESDIITIHNLEKIEIIKKKDLIYCKSEGRYTMFYLLDRTITASKNLGYYEPFLNKNFIRVHNSYILNIEHIKVINKKNGVFCEMSNEKKIPVSKRNQSLLYNL